MPNYPGKRKGTRRIVIWAKLEGDTKSRAHEWVIAGTKKEGEEFESRKRIELGHQRREEYRTAPGFSDFCQQRYRPYAEANLKGSTWRKVRKYQLATLIERIGNVKLTEFSVLTIETLKVELRQQMGASSVNNHLRVLRTILNYARQLGVPVPDLKWKQLPVPARNVAVWDDRQAQRLYRAAAREAPELENMLAFLLNSGCRKGEALAAEWSWVDWPAKMLRIPGDKTKNQRPRSVPIGDALETVLRRAAGHPTLLFPNQNGEQYVEFPKDAYWAVRKAAGLRGGVHTTRHTYASHFLKNRPDLFLLAQVLGHSHQRVTELYSHLLPEHLSRARNAVHLMPNHGRNRGTNVVSMRNR